MDLIQSPKTTPQKNLENVLLFPAKTKKLAKKTPKNIQELTSSLSGPIEIKMKAILSRIKDSKYPDTFDWGIYDKIAARYGKEQPRGGVVFNTTFKLANHHSSCRKCHYSFEVDTYGRGCIHNCVYCYALDQLTTHGYWNRPMPFPVNMAEIRKVFYTVFETNKKSKWRDILEKRIPIRIGSMSDSFMWMDRKYKVTQELLKILSFYDYPYIIFTRSDLVATDEYINLLRKDLCSVQMSIAGENEELTRLIEPGAPSVSRRFKALTKLSKEGFWTTARLNPLFPHKPDGYYTDKASIEKRFGSKDKTPSFELSSWDFPKIVAETGCKSLLAGFVRLSPFAINQMTKATGTNLKEFFKPELYANKGDKRYSDSEIAFYYTKLHQECIKAGIRFTTCYIGNGEKDYYQYQDLWSNKGDCCDAMGHVPAMKTSAQQIDWKTRLTQASNKVHAKKSQAEEKKFSTEYKDTIKKYKEHYPKDAYGYNESETPLT